MFNPFISFTFLPRGPFDLKLASVGHDLGLTLNFIKFFMIFFLKRMCQFGFPLYVRKKAHVVTVYCPNLVFELPKLPILNALVQNHTLKCLMRANQNYRRLKKI